MSVVTESSCEPYDFIFFYPQTILLQIQVVTLTAHITIRKANQI